MKIKLFFFFFIIFSLFNSGEDSAWSKAPVTPKIVFSSLRDNNAEVYIMNPDGSEQLNLSNHPSNDFEPTFSPTGEVILFVSDREGIRDLYLMNADGTNQRRVFEVLAYRDHPTWDPSGTRIVYTRPPKSAIYIAEIDGKEETRLASTGALGGYPAWNPRSEEIVFVLRNKKWLGSYQLRVIDVQTRLQKTLFPDKLPWMERPAWSPNGHILAFSWINRKAKNFDEFAAAVHAGQNNGEEAIYIAHPDGSGWRRVTDGRCFSAAWSPHNDELLYQKEVNNQKQLFKIAFESRVKTQLTHVGDNLGADWFDPAVLPVHPQPKLLTTIWGKLKKK